MNDDSATNRANPYAEAIRAMDRAHQVAREYLERLPERMVSRLATPETMAAALDEPLPETESDPARVVDEWLRQAAPGIVASAGRAFSDLSLVE